MGAQACCSSSPTASDAAGSVDASVQSLPAVLPDIVKDEQQPGALNAPTGAADMLSTAETDTNQEETAAAEEAKDAAHEAERREAEEAGAKKKEEEQKSEEEDLKAKQAEAARKIQEFERKKLEDQRKKKAALELKKEEAEKKKRAAEEQTKRKEEEELQKKQAEQDQKDAAKMKKLLAEAGENFCKAAGNGKVKLVKQLLDAGGNPDEQDAKGRRSLQVAIVEGNVNIVKMLLEGKANVNLQGNGIQTGATYPLHVAAKEATAQMAQILMEAGADPTLKNQRNQTAELVAEGKKNMAFVKAVRDFKTKAEKDKKDTNVTS